MLPLEEIIDRLAGVRSAVQPYHARGFDWLIRAHRLLRQHGQELCRRTQPRCDRCPLSETCNFYAGGAVL